MRNWTAEELRLHVEVYLLSAGDRLGVELLGTRLPDENHLTVLVRSKLRGTEGQVQSVNFDLNVFHDEGGATTIEHAVDETLHGAVNFLDMHEIGVDQSGIRHWASSNRGD
jgi:hypothetical protein